MNGLRHRITAGDDKLLVVEDFTQRAAFRSGDGCANDETVLNLEGALRLSPRTAAENDME